jgi:hypothetical protein
VVSVLFCFARKHILRYHRIASSQRRVQMAAIPSFVLKRLYVKGSLCNGPEGCEFTVQNEIASGTVTRIHSLEIDGIPYPLEEAVGLGPDGTARRLASISL